MRKAKMKKIKITLIEKISNLKPRLIKMPNPVVCKADGPIYAFEDCPVAPLEMNGLAVRKAIDDAALEGVAVVPVEGTPT